MPSLGWTEILIIVLIIIVLFGAKKIPDLMKSLGSGMKEFKKAINPEEQNNEKLAQSTKSEINEPKN